MTATPIAGCWTAVGPMSHHPVGAVRTPAIWHGVLSARRSLSPVHAFRTQPKLANTRASARGMTYCSNQASASRHGSMSLTACMALCKSMNCQFIQYDCNTDCWLLDSCGTYELSTCGSSTYFRDLTWGVVSATQPQPGACFPNTAQTGEFTCTGNMYCSNQASASKHGFMSLTACMALCKSMSCQFIQYDCNTDCWLLDSCGTYELSTCGSSTYFRDLTWGVVSATQPQPGACFPNTAQTGEYTCTGNMYCSNQASASKHGSMSLTVCMALCKTMNCQFIQYDCNTDCWLLDNCGTYAISTCGSSLYHNTLFNTPTMTSIAPVLTAPVPVPAPPPSDDSGVVVLTSIGGGLSVVILGMLGIFLRRLRAKRQMAAVTPVTPMPTDSPDRSKPARVRVSQMDEEAESKAKPLSDATAESLPDNWGRKIGSKQDLTFDDLVYVPHADLNVFQTLLNKTYRPIPTQDRPCPNKKCDKQKGGCPCVQRGGDPGLPTGYQLMRVIRVEDSGMFDRYVKRRSDIRRKRGSCKPPDSQFFTAAAMEHDAAMKSALGSVDDDTNEVFLWHGTQIRKGLAIAQDDFDLSFAGSGAGTMYGKGLYFAESCTKADEYAKDEDDGHYEKIHAMLLCRVCVGNYHYVTDRDPSAIDHFHRGDTDSTIGDRAAAVHTYREIVVYDADQVYPEYLVLYKRLHKGQHAQPVSESRPFVLELPVYWLNVGKNPFTESFNVHYKVREKIRATLQRLAMGCSANKPRVVSARRVEDSSLWVRYIRKKSSLGNALDDRGEDKFKPPNELDGKPETGHSLTTSLLREKHTEDTVSLENIQYGLNEMLLWHGTDRAAATVIAEEGFLVLDAKHGRRFGNGVYLAEDLDKSLSYAPEVSGRRHVLLCRAVCGDMHYTEQHWESSADSTAKKNGKHSVLANPDGVGPREYVLFEEDQVYPEYLLEIES
eukprot:TRINITY_DN3783_c0_g2_i4.p1 TRINITY_DN3783_c0_g2~~TRINITY_DN3783_c0_g2_i4.p1  ORF type:complete len:944 (+),score=114.28 TRINITY_DN3783_c0_g2_i4:37-2868(+)